MKTFVITIGVPVTHGLTFDSCRFQLLSSNTTSSTTSVSPIEEMTVLHDSLLEEDICVGEVVDVLTLSSPDSSPMACDTLDHSYCQSSSEVVSYQLPSSQKTVHKCILYVKLTYVRKFYFKIVGTV